jgi:hypothetical protein
MIRLTEIPTQAALVAGGKVSHTELARAIKQARQEYRSLRAVRRETPK